MLKVFSLKNCPALRKPLCLRRLGLRPKTSTLALFLRVLCCVL